MAYSRIFWALIHPTGPNPRTGKNAGIEVIGDDAAVDICEAMMTSHGFRPVIIPGDLSVLAPNYEIAFTGRVRKGQEGCPPPVGSGKDGTVGPFTAPPMIAFDVMGEKFSRLFLVTKTVKTSRPQRHWPLSRPNRIPGEDDIIVVAGTAIHGCYSAFISSLTYSVVDSASSCGPNAFTGTSPSFFVYS